MVRDHGNPRIAVVLFQDGYRFIYILYCMLCQDGDCDVTVRTLYRLWLVALTIQNCFVVHPSDRSDENVNSYIIQLVSC